MPEEPGRVAEAYREGFSAQKPRIGLGIGRSDVGEQARTAALGVLETALPAESERRIYRLCAVCAVLAIASLIVPRFVSNPEGGFAGAASAILTLLIMLGATLLFSLYLLIVTVRNYKDLSTAARIAGIGPGVVLAATMFGLFGMLGY